MILSQKNLYVLHGLQNKLIFKFDLRTVCESSKLRELEITVSNFTTLGVDWTSVFVVFPFLRTLSLQGPGYNVPLFLLSFPSSSESWESVLYLAESSTCSPHSESPDSFNPGTDVWARIGTFLISFSLSNSSLYSSFLPSPFSSSYFFSLSFRSLHPYLIFCSLMLFLPSLKWRQTFEANTSLHEVRVDQYLDYSLNSVRPNYYNTTWDSREYLGFNSYLQWNQPFGTDFRKKGRKRMSY